MRSNVHNDENNDYLDHLELSLGSKLEIGPLNRDNPCQSVYTRQCCLNSLRVLTRKLFTLLYMDVSLKTSVMIIENDSDFRELLNGIFERSENFELVGSYVSIEEFAVALLQHKPETEWLPQLMVVDVLSSNDPRVEGASFMSALRAEGLNFATLLVSSMDFGALLRVLRKSHPNGWATLQKTSRLTEDQVIEAASTAVSEMLNND
mgnify:FL=1